jgi:hypothetical protein
MQVSERVTGFIELRGPNRTTHTYDADSPHSQRPLHRFFETTGVCWYFENCAPSARSAQAIMDAFCERLAIQHRDLGFGLFQAKSTPMGQGSYRGLCVFDSTNGSLRLSQTLAERFIEVVTMAADRATRDQNTELASELAALLVESQHLRAAESIDPFRPDPTSETVVEVVAAGEPAMLVTPEQTQEVSVLGWRYTPLGLMYQLQHTDTAIKWQVGAIHIRPIHGRTRTERMDLMTGQAAA